MLRNYIKIAFRNILKQKVYSLINVFGLAIGIAACIIVGIFIENELSFDKHNTNAEKILRVAINKIRSNTESISAESPALLAPTMVDEYPDVKYASRIYFSSDDLVQYGDSKFYENNVAYADPDYMKMFTHSIIIGKRENLLLDKNTVILTESAAKKYFDNDNPVGKVLRINNQFDFIIEAVIEDVNPNSHFTFDFLASYESLMDQRVGNFITQWGATFGSYTYIMLNEGISKDAFQQKCSNLITEKSGPTPGLDIKLILQPMLDIHLYSNLDDEIQPNSSITFILIIISIALFILILAGINFVNLSTARAVKRAREIGVRKVVGALRIQIIKQFLSESILISLIALLVSVLLVELFKPVFAAYIGTNLEFKYLTNVNHIAVVVLTTCLVGICAGLYPAFVLSYIKPINALKSKSSLQAGVGGGINLRKILVVFQYSISLILIITTLVINDQTTFMRNFNMGFDKDYMLRFETPNRIGDKYKTYKTEFGRIPGVLSSSACLGSPISDNGFGTNLKPKVENNGEQFSIGVRFVDHDYIEHFGLELIAGQPLSAYSENNNEGIMIVNESLVKSLGYTPNEALGKSYRLGLNQYEPQIAGVVKDYNFKSLHEEIQPNVFMYLPSFFRELVLKVEAKNLSETMASIESLWNNYYPDYPFQYSFMDDEIDKYYKSEEQAAGVVATFSTIAIIIASLGLIGLTFYTTEDKRKEIGVRKVMGASVTDIVKGLTWEFLMLIAIASGVALPIGYYLSEKWLSQFPYQVDISLFLFLNAALIVVAISLSVISYSVIKSAAANPIDSLRSE